VALDLQHQTAAQFAARFWRRVLSAYQAGDKFTYHYLIWWVWARIQAGDLTSNDVRLSFNAAFGRSLSVAQWNDLVTTRFVPMKDRYLSMLAEGEL
jgi:hypothetical protein